MEFKNIKVYGLDESIIRSGFPMQIGEPKINEYSELQLPNDTKRAIKLANAPIGSGHNNYMKGIIVQFDMSYPQYFTPQLQRYHWIDIISSQSKMHSLTKIEDIKSSCNKYVLPSIIMEINYLIRYYNLQDNYPFLYPCNMIDDNHAAICVNINSKEELFQYIISNLPMGFELWMGISTNYLQLKTIYKQRKNHKLKNDWGEFCTFIENLPMSELIIGKEC
jgi:hypothetical protein